MVGRGAGGPTSKTNEKEIRSHTLIPTYPHGPEFCEFFFFLSHLKNGSRTPPLSVDQDVLSPHPKQTLVFFEVWQTGRRCSFPQTKRLFSSNRGVVFWGLLWRSALPHSRLRPLRSEARLGFGADLRGGPSAGPRAAARVGRSEPLGWKARVVVFFFFFFLRVWVKKKNTRNWIVLFFGYGFFQIQPTRSWTAGLWFHLSGFHFGVRVGCSVVAVFLGASYYGWESRALLVLFSPETCITGHWGSRHAAFAIQL